MVREKINRVLVIVGVLVGLGVASGPVSAATIVIDPDASGILLEDNISSFFSDLGVTLSAVGVADTNVYATELAWAASTPPNVFGWSEIWAGETYFESHWARSSSPLFRADFTGFVAEEVSVYAFSERGPATLEAFGASGSLGTTTGSGYLAIASSGEGIDRIVLEFEAVPGADVGVIDQLVITPRVPVVPLPSAVGMGLAVLGGMGLMRKTRTIWAS